jgi:hypothetical protein
MSDLPDLPTLPDSSLLPIPQAGALSAQLSQGESLLTAAQGAAGGDSASQASLIKGACTALTSATSGLPKTLITDAASVATGFAVGGPVGGCVALASAAVGLLGLLFGSGPTGEPQENTAWPTTASEKNAAKVSLYIQNVIGAGQSGQPPGWYLARLYARMLPAPTAGVFRDRWQILKAAATDTTVSAAPNLSLWIGVNGGEPLSWYAATSPDAPSGLAPTPSDSWVKRAVAVSRTPTESTASINAYALAWPSLLTNAPTPTFDLSVDSWGPSDFMTAAQVSAYNAANAGKPFFSPLSPGTSVAGARAQAISDTPEVQGLSKETILDNALRRLPSAKWWEGGLYAGAWGDPSGLGGAAYVQLDILNAFGTVLAMYSQGAHPRAVVSELLMQQRAVYEFGGPSPSEKNLAPNYRLFIEECLALARAKPVAPLLRSVSSSKRSTASSSPASPAPSASRTSSASPFLVAGGLGTVGLAAYAAYKYRLFRLPF